MSPKAAAKTILCLHGYSMTAATMQSAIKGIAKQVGKSCQFVYVDAPFESKDSVRKGRAWWEAEKNSDGSWTYHNFEKSVAYLRDLNAGIGPFDGVLGFSQGAAMLSALVAMKSLPNPPVSFNFAIFVSGFRYSGQNHHNLFANETPFRVPSLHVIGEADTVIKPSSSHNCSKLFFEPTVFTHTGGHIIPQKPEELAVFEEFFNRFSSTTRKSPLPKL